MLTPVDMDLSRVDETVVTDAPCHPRLVEVTEQTERSAREGFFER